MKAAAISPKWTIARRDVLVLEGINSESRNPATAAAPAANNPHPINEVAARTCGAGSTAERDAKSRTRLVNQQLTGRRPTIACDLVCRRHGRDLAVSVLLGIELADLTVAKARTASVRAHAKAVRTQQLSEVEVLESLLAARRVHPLPRDNSDVHPSARPSDSAGQPQR